MPKVEKIALELKMSRQVSDGPWTTKSLGLRAEAALSPHETLQMASEELYHDLAAQLRLLWGSETPLPRQEAQPAVGDEEIEEPPAPTQRAGKPPDGLLKAALEMGGVVPEPESPPNWCGIHDCEMKQYRGERGGTWFAHQALDDETGQEYWCRGKARKWCSVHMAMMDQRSWGGFSHKVGNQWCHGEPPKQRDVPPPVDYEDHEEEIPF